MENCFVDQKEHVLIRYPSRKDAEIMQNYFNTLSAEMTYIRSQGEQVSLEEQKLFIEKVLQNISNHKTVRLLLFVKDQLAGVANIDLSEKTASHIGELGISISQQFRGKGLGHLLLKIVIEEAKKNLLGVEIITLEVFANNKTARSLYKKLGFVEYGVLPHGVKLPKSYDDNVLMYKEMR